MTTFTQDWIHNKGIIEYWDKYLEPIKGKPLKMLEIGSFEGMSTIWFLESVLTHPESRIDCVDTFEGDGQQQAMGVDTKNIRDRFVENTKIYKEKINIITQDSQTALYDLFPHQYDLIYIDGSHYQTHVLHDAVLSWDRLKRGGFLIFDDYGMNYTDKEGKFYNPAKAIDAFIEVYQAELKVLHKQWQIIIQKLL